MDFTSLPFLFIFFPIFLAAYLIARPSLRLLLISLANVAFLVAGQASALLPLIVIALVGYVVGRLIELKRGTKAVVSTWLWFGIAINVGILAMFKVAGAYRTYPGFLESFQVNGVVSLLG